MGLVREVKTLGTVSSLNGKTAHSQGLLGHTRCKNIDYAWNSDM